MLTPPTRRSMKALDNLNWSGSPPSSGWAKWFGGVIVPVILMCYGAICIITGRGHIPAEIEWFQVEGTGATAWGVALAAFGVFFWVHYFLGNVLDDWRWFDEVKTVLFLIRTVGLGWLAILLFWGPNGWG